MCLTNLLNIPYRRSRMYNYSLLIYISNNQKKNCLCLNNKSITIICYILVILNSYYSYCLTNIIKQYKSFN